ncbi:hypothetical protein M0C34_06680 [Agarivorans sp. TSD2052]|uniref:hypothetical protein n=1 Tax=Agarivorans sp. TSD2052 TaxID=2937286 RepID=UPI00200FF2C6|nr:hypothetical protein [Agarivorans sp. TSD2052]UPW19941.1 hypothetical protein M0C34_06680 [Agarivorans sp. TSD2052]
MKKYLLVAMLTVIPATSYACSHDMLFSAPHLHDHDALIEALNQSQGKQPKPFTLSELPAKPNKAKFQAKGLRKLPGYKMPPPQEKT